MGIVLEIKVVPVSGRRRCVCEANNVIKCYLKSPPERGKANNELVAMLASALGIPRDQVTIISGQTSRRKRLKIEADLTHEQVLDALGIARQLSLV